MYRDAVRRGRTRRATRATARTSSGRKAIAVPGALAGWCEALARFGTLPLADVIAPAIRLAERGFIVTPLSRRLRRRLRRGSCARCRPRARLFLPGRQRRSPPGARLVQADYARKPAADRRDGRCALYDGPLGAALTSHHGAHRRADRRGGSRRLQADRARAGARALSRTSRSSARRRRPRPACISCRCSTSSRATTSARWASARPTPCICWPRR